MGCCGFSVWREELVFFIEIQTFFEYNNTKNESELKAHFDRASIQ